jgi:hypothetical protein
MAQGNIVLLGSNALTNDLEHELVHVEQFEKYPLIQPILYMLESIRHGYLNNRFEREAYEKAGNRYITFEERVAIEKAESYLREFGYKDVYEWFDPAHTVYEEHEHEYAVKLVIIAGSISMFVGGKEYVLQDNSLFMSRNSKHSAKVGEQGCLYVVGEWDRSDRIQ